MVCICESDILTINPAALLPTAVRSSPSHLAIFRLVTQRVSAGRVSIHRRHRRSLTGLVLQLYAPDHKERRRLCGAVPERVTDRCQSPRFSFYTVDFLSKGAFAQIFCTPEVLISTLSFAPFTLHVNSTKWVPPHNRALAI